MRRRIITTTALGAIGLLALSACSAGGDDGGDESRGDITIWYSNNEAEIEWGKQMVEAWNADHPDEQIKAQEIPAGASSEEAIGAAITAGNAPCLVYNTSPGRGAGVPEAGRPREPVAVRRRRRLHHRALGRRRRPVPIERRRLLPDAVEVQPRDDLLQQGHVRRRPASTPRTRRWPRTTSSSRPRASSCHPVPRSTRSGPRRRASSSRAGSTSTRCMRRSRAARSCSRTARRRSTTRTARRSPTSGRRSTPRASPATRRTTATRSPTGSRRCRSWGRGRSRSTARSVNWGSVPVPTQDGTDPSEETYTFSDAKNIGMFTACDNQATAWDVLKFSTSEEQDGAWLEATGQMPLRQDLTSDLPRLLRGEPRLRAVRRPGLAAPSRCRTCRTRSRSGRTFRDGYSKAVIFGEEDVPTFLEDAADEDRLARGRGLRTAAR